MSTRKVKLMLLHGDYFEQFHGLVRGFSHLTFNCSKSAIEILVKGVKYVQS